MDLLEQSFLTDYKTFEGWCTVEKARKLIELVKEKQPKLSVELGVFAGKSLLPLAVASKHYNSHSKVIGIDSWTKNAALEGTNDVANDEWWAKIDYAFFIRYTNDLMKLFHVDDIVELWKNKSSEVVNKFEDQSIDILHQDSNHSEEISCSEVELYWNKVVPGGYWVFDDANWESTNKAQELLKSKGYEEIYSSPQNEWKIYKRLD